MTAERTSDRKAENFGVPWEKSYGYVQTIQHGDTIGPGRGRSLEQAVQSSCRRFYRTLIPLGGIDRALNRNRRVAVQPTRTGDCNVRVLFSRP